MSDKWKFGDTHMEDMMCTGKKQFDVAAHAFRAARHLSNGAAPYRCRYCHFWHLGNSKIVKHGSKWKPANARR